MDEELARRSHALLMEAVDLPQDQREVYLSKVCSGDVKLRSHIDRLLAAMDRSDTFLETPALEARTVTETPVLRPNTKIDGKYEVVRVVGIGGMATVYEAIQKEPYRRVALKVMRMSLAHTSAVNRFKYETEILGHIQHPGIVQIFEAGTWEEAHGFSVPYFAMEYIAEPRTITGYAREKKLSTRERLLMFTAVCDAVQHGHANSIIHRDLKPGNVLVDESGRPRVIDFGVARSIEPAHEIATRHTSHGQLIGTLNYMSPEQCEGDGEVDIRTDVYSLGVILYELLAGRLPHDLTRTPIPDALRIIRDVDPPRLGTLNPDLRGDIDAIVMKAMDKEPNRRYPTVAAFANDIRRYLDDETIEARPPTMIHQCRLFVRRNRGLVSALSTILLTIIVGSAFSIRMAYVALQESEQRGIAEQNAIAERDAAIWQNYLANIAGGFAAVQINEIKQLRTRLANTPAHHRGWEWGFLSGLADRSERAIVAHEGALQSFTMSPDGSLFASGGKGGSLRVWNAHNGELIAEYTEPSGLDIFALTFSHNGTWLFSSTRSGTVTRWPVRSDEQPTVVTQHASAVESILVSHQNIFSLSFDGELRVHNVDTLLPEPAAIQPTEKFRAMTVSQDGRYFIMWNPQGLFHLYDLPQGQLLRTFDFPNQHSVAAIDPNTTRIAFGGSKGLVTISDLHTGETLHELAVSISNSTIRSLTFSPDGKRLACGQYRHNITIWKLDQEEISDGYLLGHEDAVIELFFSPDGDRLHSASWDLTILTWNVSQDPAKRTVVQLQAHDDNVLAVGYAPNGSMVATGGIDHVVRLWDPDLAMMLAQYYGHTGDIFAVHFSPDSTRLASASSDRSVRVWDTRTGENLAIYSDHKATVWTVAFSPNGAYLASGGDDRTAIIRNATTGDILHTLKGHSARIIRVAFSPDSQLLATSSRDGTVRLWRTDTGEQVHHLIGHQSDVFALLFNHDGTVLYSGARDQTVRGWDVTTGAQRHLLDGHGQFITCLTQSADGRRLVGSSWLGNIVLWDLPTHDQIATFRAHEEPIRSVAFDPEGRRLASISYDKTLRFYDTLYGQQRRDALAEARATHAKARAWLDELLQTHASPQDIIKTLESDTTQDELVRQWAGKLLLQSLTCENRDDGNPGPSATNPLSIGVSSE